MVKIYLLKDPRDINKGYVGKTITSLSARLSNHLHEKGNNLKHNWLKKLATLKLTPEIVLIEEVEDSIWKEKEKYWIKYYREVLKWDLKNITAGGEQDWEYTRIQKIKDKRQGWIPSDETRAIWSKQRLGRPSVNKGIALLNTTKQKISNSVKKTMSDPVLRRKISEAHIGKSPWNKGLKMTTPSPKKGKCLSEEQKQKIRDSLKKTFSDPLMRAKVGAPKGGIPWNKGKTFKTLSVDNL
jgi:hypothetical protein